MALVKKYIIDLSLRKMPVVKLVIPYVAGVMLSTVTVIPVVDVWIASLICLLVLLYVLLWRNSKICRKIFIPGLLYVFFFVLGYGQAVKNEPAVDHAHFAHGNFDVLQGYICDEPVVREKTIRFPMQIESAALEGRSKRVSGKLMVTLLRDSVDAVLGYGDSLALRNVSVEVASPKNPHEFNYARFLANKNIWHQVLLTTRDFKKVGVSKGNPVIAVSLRARQHLVDAFGTYIADQRAYQVAVALLFGYRSDIDPATLKAFTNTGTIHILSVSGLHVGLVFGLLTFLLRWMERFRYGIQLRLLFILMAVWGYVVLTGMAPPILRAGIMISFFLIAQAARRKQVPLNTLVASAFFILLFDPRYLFDVGFQLSYMAMLGIFLLYPLLCHIFLPKQRVLKVVMMYGYVSIAAQLFTMPFALYYFGQFPTYFLPANLFIALPGTAIMYVGLALAVCPWGLCSGLLGQLLEQIIRFTLTGLQWIETLPYASIKGISWGAPQVLLALVLLACLVGAINYKNKGALWCHTAVLSVLVLSMGYTEVRRRQYTATHVYNVRSNLAIAEIRNGKAILFSSLDSLHHATLSYSVLPDLLHYVSESNIQFVPIASGVRKNALIGITAKHILILEDRASPVEWERADLVVWRRNVKMPLDSVRSSYGHIPILFDGSNSDRYIEQKMKELHEIQQPLYKLKDNFAYVWKEE